jgi:tetratricopeptide (TPR) repeat protein
MTQLQFKHTPDRPLKFSWPSLLSTALALSFAVSAAAPALAFDELKWATYTHDGQKALEIQNYGGAESNWVAALEQLKGASDADKSAHLGDSLTNLGNLYSSRGQFAKAEAYFEKALKVKEFVLGAQDKATVTSKVKLCQLYLSQGKSDKAMPIVDKMADYGEVQSRELSELIIAYNNLERFNIKHKKTDAATKSQQDADKAVITKRKEQSQDIAIQLDSLGTAVKELKTERAYRQAERLYKSALALRQNTLTPEHAALASSLENLGRLYQAEGKYTRAENLLRSSYEISLNTLGPDRMETAQRLDYLAQVLANEGKINEAESFYRKILDPQRAPVTDKNSGGKNADKKSMAKPPAGRNQADMAANMAALLVKQGRYGEAVPYYNRALKIQESINGPQHASLVTLLDSYAYALSRANRGGEAQRLVARSRSIRGM